MKTLKKYILATAALSVLSTSCKEEWLDRPNPNLPTTETFWKTPDDAVRGVNAIYQSLYYDGTYLRFAPVASDVRGDDIKVDSPWDVLQLTGSFSLRNDMIMQEWLWVAFYGGVYRANLAIENIEKIQMEAGLKDRLMGQARFLRGLYYFHLANYFNNIPLVTSTFKSPEEYYQAQSSPEQVWDQIYQDFTEAARLLPVRYSEDPGSADLGRATKGAALGFLGKAYLFNKNYTEAAKQFKALMDLGAYGLVPNYADNFNESGENNRESLFEIQFDRDAGGTVIGWIGSPGSDWSKTTARATTYGPEGFSWGDVVPSRWIFEEFQKEKSIDGTEDARLKVSIIYDYPGSELYGVPYRTAYKDFTKIFVRKYQNDQSGRKDEFDIRSGINERLLRYADVLLMYAECQNELGNRAEAAKYIQQVRDRAKLPNREAEFAAYSKEQLAEQLSHERALEFCFEGHRFDDLRRWGWLQNGPKLNELKQHDSEFNSYVPGREYFSIPQGELETNTKLIQNPGY